MPIQFSDLGISAPILKAISELKIVEIQQAIPLLLTQLTWLGLPKLHRKNSCFWIASFTINRYKLIFDTGACFGSLGEGRFLET
jgi:hypothetical protein